MSDARPVPAVLTPSRRGRFASLRRVLVEEFGGWSPALSLACFLGNLLPTGSFGRVRARLFALAGARVGQGAMMAGVPTFSPRSRASNLTIGARCYLNAHVHIDAAGAPVVLGDGVSIGHHALIVTSDHTLGPPEFRAGPPRPAPVTIGDGAWIAAGALVLPGVTVGEGAVIAGGAVVTRDVPPNTLVGGVPARDLKELPVSTY